MTRIVQRAEMRNALKKEWQMKSSNPYRGTGRGGYIVSLVSASWTGASQPDHKPTRPVSTPVGVRSQNMSWKYGSTRLQTKPSPVD